MDRFVHWNPVVFFFMRYSGSCVDSVQSDFRRKIKLDVEQKEFMSAHFNAKNNMKYDISFTENIVK